MVRLPTEIALGGADVEPERVAIGEPVVGAEWREVQSAQRLHRDHGGARRQRADPRSRAGVTHQCLQRLPHGAELPGAQVVDRGPGSLAGQAVGDGQVVGVYELEPVVAPAEDEYV